MAMLSAMDQIISTASSGDSVVIQFAGHGTQVKDLDADEVDGTDEALVPIDFGGGAFVIDDDIRRLMLKIPAGVSVTCFMDCCHSGTNTRLFGTAPETDPEGSRPRFMRATPEMNAAHSAFRMQMREGPAPSGRAPDSMREINFAACLPDQVAFESAGSGDFTRRAVSILTASGVTITNASFLAKVIAAFGTGTRQQPNLDCASASTGLLLFGSPAASGCAPVFSAQDLLLSRLDEIEKRLSKLGA